jgi:hypothetical protein
MRKADKLKLPLLWNLQGTFAAFFRKRPFFSDGLTAGKIFAIM